MIGISSFDDGRHDLRRDGGEENAVAKMAGGNVIAGGRGWAENRQRVRSSRTQAGPVLEDLRVAELGKDDDLSLIHI